jgi:hypothetical protein
MFGGVWRCPPVFGRYEYNHPKCDICLLAASLELMHCRICFELGEEFPERSMMG